MKAMNAASGCQDYANAVNSRLDLTPYPGPLVVEIGSSLTTLIRPAATFSRSRERRNRGEGELCFVGRFSRGCTHVVRWPRAIIFRPDGRRGLRRSSRTKPRAFWPSLAFIGTARGRRGNRPTEHCRSSTPPECPALPSFISTEPAPPRRHPLEIGVARSHRSRHAIPPRPRRTQS